MIDVKSMNNPELLDYFLTIERFGVAEKDLNKYNEWLEKREEIRHEILRRMEESK